MKQSEKYETCQNSEVIAEMKRVRSLVRGEAFILKNRLYRVSAIGKILITAYSVLPDGKYGRSIHFGAKSMEWVGINT